MSLPGTTRDLDTIEAHIERLEKHVLTLWEADGMVLHMLKDGKGHENRGLLRDIRYDIGAALSTIKKMEKALTAIAASHPSVKADVLQSIAKQTMRGQTNERSSRT